MHRRALALAAFGILVAGCAGTADQTSPAVSRAALQTDITERLTKAGDAPRSVTCRSDLVGEVGRTARCDVEIGETNSFQPIVTVTGVDGGEVHYELKPALSQSQLETAVSRLVADDTGSPADAVACESGLTGDVEAAAYCDVDAGGTRDRRVVRVTKVAGLTMDFALTSG